MWCHWAAKDLLQISNGVVTVVITISAKEVSACMSV